jgi:pimeloyl-ACP methyl ester carboxylesterase
MGGSIGLGIGAYSPERFRSLIIGGMGMAETNSRKEIIRRKAFIEVFREGNEATIAWFERIYGVLSPEMKEDLMGNDPEALIACWSVREQIGFEYHLPLAHLPCLFYVGDKDYLYQRSKQTAEIIPGASFVSLPGLDHFGGFRHSEVVLPHILNFLASIS